MGKSPRIHAARDRTAVLLAHGRKCGIPIASCYTAYHTAKDVPFWKVAAVRNGFLEGTREAEMDDLIADSSYDYILRKTAPSIFFQTPLTGFLTKHRIDTVIVTGCVTSGCVRASMVDPFLSGCRTVVVEDCCGDPGQEDHEANLKVSAGDMPTSCRASRLCATSMTYADAIVERLPNLQMPVCKSSTIEQQTKRVWKREC